MSMDHGKMVIDLTQDSDLEDRSPHTLSQPSTLFSRLANRAFSSSVPQKRKSDRDSDSEPPSLLSFPLPGLTQPTTGRRSPSPPSLPSGNITNAISWNQNRDYRAKSSPSPVVPGPAVPNPVVPAPPKTPPIDEHNAISVVVPSPSLQLRQEIKSAEWILPSLDTEITGLSEKYYPTDALEKRAIQGAYPRSRKVNRADVPLQIRSVGPFLTQRLPVADQLRESLQRKFAAIKGPRVSVAPADELLLAQSTSNFEFINEYKLRKGAMPIAEEFLGGCGCETICNPDRCVCLTLEINSNEPIMPYKCAEDDKRIFVLSLGFMSRTSMIYECNSLCSCNERCWNRLVQQGRTVRLEIFHTDNRGFGLRSPDRIRAGQFIDLYLGEVLTKKVADTREEIASATKSHSYLFGLDFHIDDEDIYVVDGQRFGAPTRFINHSCNPNCRMFTVSRTHGDQRLYDLAFFAVREIPPNTELTFDYNPGWGKTTEVDPNAVPCLCGEKDCRGQLWPSERKRTTK